MSYYGNPYQQFFGGNASGPRHYSYHPQTSSYYPQQSFNIFAAPESSPHHHHRPAPFQFGHAAYTAPHPAYPEFSGSHFGHGPTSLEDEERAARAHLRAIQHRREAEQASIRRDAAIRAEVERREAIQKAAEQAQRDRQAAIARMIEEKQRKRQAAIEAAVAEQVRQEAIRSAIQAKRQAHVDAHRARLAAVAQAQEQYARQEQQERYERAVQRRAECARRCAAKCAQKASRVAADKAKVEYKDEFEALNGILGGLFGINFVNDQADTQKTTLEDKPEGDKEKAEISKPAKSTEPTRTPAPATTPASKTDKQSNFPADVNDLLSQFLGLHIEPAAATDKPADGASKDGIPQGLNEFLSRFGLVFEPLDVEKEVQTGKTETEQASGSEKSVEQAAAAVAADPPVETLPATPAKVPTPPTPASTSTPAPPIATAAGPAAATASSNKQRVQNQHEDDAPFTSFLNSLTDLPPFVRDILGNVEIAFKEDLARQRGETKEHEVKIEGKGKGVAAGEKREKVPAPGSTKPASTITGTGTAATATATPAIDNTSIKPASPFVKEEETPSPSTSLAKLSSISEELDLVLESFTFPSTLSFGPSPLTHPEGEAVPPALLFNKANSPYHAQANKLLQLLLAADGVTSGGNKEVRRKRKEIVRKVEKELEELEHRRDRVWEEVKERRENGIESDHEDLHGSGSSSETGSVVDHSENHAIEVEVEHEHEHEHIEYAQPGAEATSAEEFKVEQSKAPQQLEEVASSPTDESAVGFAVPAGPEVAEADHDRKAETHPDGSGKPGVNEIHTVEIKAKPDDGDDQEKEQAGTQGQAGDKKEEEGYELL